MYFVPSHEGAARVTRKPDTISVCSPLNLLGHFLLLSDEGILCNRPRAAIFNQSFTLMIDRILQLIKFLL